MAKQRDRHGRCSERTSLVEWINGNECQEDGSTMAGIGERPLWSCARAVEKPAASNSSKNGPSVLLAP
jgi:hypothetical protein